MDLTNVTWDLIPDGEDPFMKKGTLPDGRIVHVPRRELNADELKRLSEIAGFDTELTPEVIERGQQLAKELGLGKE